MKFDALEESGRHLGASWRLMGGICRHTGGIGTLLGGIWRHLGSLVAPKLRAPGWWKVKPWSGEAIRGPNQQDTNQPDLLIPDQQLDSTPDWQTGNWRLETETLENSRFADCKAFPRSLVAPGKQGPADLLSVIKHPMSMLLITYSP